MSVFDVVLARRSIRKYENKPIPKDILDKIIEAGRQSPSAANMQPYRFVIVTDPKTRKQLKGLISRSLEKAPAIIIGCANTKAPVTGNWAPIDTAIALQTMVLTAWSLGIGSCWIGIFKEQKIKEKLKIPESWTIIVLLALGYPKENPKPRPRKPIDELFSYNQF